MIYNTLLGLHRRTDRGFLHLLCEIQVAIDDYSITTERPVSIHTQHMQAITSEDLQDSIYIRAISRLIAETIAAVSLQ